MFCSCRCAKVFVGIGISGTYISSRKMLEKNPENSIVEEIKNRTEAEKADKTAKS